MNTKPKELTEAEKSEIAAVKAVRECWGANTPDEFIEYLDNSIYAVKFDFISGSPGYCGDLIALYGDALMQPITLIRRDGQLEIAELDG